MSIKYIYIYSQQGSVFLHLKFYLRKAQLLIEKTNELGFVITLITFSRHLRNLRL